MSWSFDFVAKSKDVAKDKLKAVHAPDAVKSFVSAAIDGLRDDSTGPTGEAAKVILINSFGHLASGTDFEKSTCSITVEWIFVHD